MCIRDSRSALRGSSPVFLILFNFVPPDYCVFSPETEKPAVWIRDRRLFREPEICGARYQVQQHFAVFGTKKAPSKGCHLCAV